MQFSGKISKFTKTTNFSIF